MNKWIWNRAVRDWHEEEYGFRTGEAPWDGRFKRQGVSDSVFLSMFTKGLGGFDVIEDALPDDARIVHVSHNIYRETWFVFESDSWDVVQKGQKIPYLSMTFQKKD